MGNCDKDYSFGRRKLLMSKKAKARRALAKRKARLLGKSPNLKELQMIARANDVSIYKRRKDDNGFTKRPLTVSALKARLTRMRVPYFFMGSELGFGRRKLLMDKKHRKARKLARQKKILMGGGPPARLEILQEIAKANDVSIYKRRKDNNGFTKNPLSKTALKARLTRMRVPYF